MIKTKFVVATPYFQAGLASRERAPWSDGESTPIVTTWVFAGTAESLDSSATFGTPRRDLVFQRFVECSNVLEQSLAEGLRVPDQEQSELPMLALDELIDALGRLGDQSTTRKFVIGKPYFQAGFGSAVYMPWSKNPYVTPFVTTWVYAGTVKQLDPSLSSGAPPHHLVFRPFVESVNVLDWKPIHGLQIPSKAQATRSMLTLCELIDDLNELSEQMKRPNG